MTPPDPETPDRQDPAATPPKGGRWSVRLGLALGATLGTLLLAELGLRLVGFGFQLYPERLEFGYPKPEVFEKYFAAHDDYLWVQNDYDERMDRARAAEPDVVFMGCSCTEWGEYDATVAQLHGEATGQRLRFANLGCSGWSSFQGLQQLQGDVLALDPDVVTIYYGWNDHWMGFGVDDATAASLTANPLLALQGSRVVQLITKAVIASSAEDGAKLGADARPDRVSPESFRRNLTDMVRICRENDIQPVLVTAPTSHRVGSEPEFLLDRWLEDLDDLVPKHQRYVAIAREVAEAEGVVLCDLAATMDELPLDRVQSFFNDDGIHFTPAGGKAVGTMLYRCLREHGLLPQG